VEPHVKERIVGAVVLVALGVWLIPWVLDGPDEPIAEPELTPALILQSPDEAAPRRTETIELQQSARRANPSPGNAPPGEPVTDTVPAQLAVADTAPVRTATPDPADDSPAVSAAPAPAPEASRAPVDTPKPAEPPSQVSGWAVQVGAFGDVANANQLASRVSRYGYSADVSEFRSGNRMMHRVRVGGFDTENEAQVAASSLSAHNITVQVIPPE